MKQKAYTLAEVLISIAIIGVLAAIMLPMMNKFKPDSAKALYISTYDAVVNAVGQMATDETLYPSLNSGDNINYTNIPFFNTVSATIAGKTYSGNTKFCEALAASLNTVGTISCPSTYDANPSFSQSFALANGAQFMVHTYRAIDGIYAVYQSDIYFDIDGDKGANCFYSNTCKKPDRFKLMVASDGTIRSADVLGQAYLGKREILRYSADNGVSKYTELATLADEDLKKVLESINLAGSTEGGSGSGSEGGDEEGGENSTGGSLKVVSLPCNNNLKWYDYRGGTDACASSNIEAAKENLGDALNWQDANNACNELGMRLPGAEELYAIFEGSAAGKLEFPKDTYWTRSNGSYGGKHNCTHGSYFHCGSQSASTKRAVRCVK